MVWSIIGKTVLKQGAKVAAKKGAKEAVKQGAKQGAKKATKEVAKKFAEKTLLEKTITILDYTDPFYWAGRGIKGVAAKRAAKKIAEKEVAKQFSKQATKRIAKKEVRKAAKRRAFRVGAAKVGFLGALGAGFAHVVSSVGEAIMSAEFLIPAAGAALGTWGMYKIKSTIDKKKAGKQQNTVVAESGDNLNAKPHKKLTPKQMRMLQEYQRQRAA